MRVSELASESGVAVATIKYYLREGLLAPGAATSSTGASYTEEHLRRLRVIRALTGSAGLSVHRTREILAIIDSPQPDLYDTLGRAVAALPPYPDPELHTDHPRARAVLERLGQLYDPGYAAVAQLEDALRAAEEAGVAIDDERIDVYGTHLRAIAEFDVARMPQGAPSSSIEYAVLGTALYEPIILALRRLAHQDVAARTLG
ncbi:MerR family transcriptional regulator [Glaciibacter flavus]|uniref:MerR family transcriptional regulator n=1 Tax=Orlajensenia flava TaxID=2565934 RepID=A0A4S4FMV5_9MICO|nr:MerR family transcriptional regulator [Glaciibacter flavus]THG31152.1 MerR family transcriptional regulator [Glaciibacter flavus]